MRICCCAMAGTLSCLYCSNNPDRIFNIKNIYLKDPRNEDEELKELLKQYLKKKIKESE